MKTLLLILALALTVSYTGTASIVKSPVTNQTENFTGSKTTTFSESGKKAQKKKPHGKKRHKASSSKKVPATKK